MLGMMQEHEYLAEKLSDEHRHHLSRLWHEPSWAERLARLAWVPLRALLRLLGQVMLVGGQFLLRLTRQARQEAADAALLSRHSITYPTYD